MHLIIPLPCKQKKSYPLQPSDKVHTHEHGIHCLHDTAPTHLNSLISNYPHLSSKIGSYAQATLNFTLSLHFLRQTMIFHSSKVFCLKFPFPHFLPIVILQGPTQMLLLLKDLLQPLQVELALSSS